MSAPTSLMVAVAQEASIQKDKSQCEELMEIPLADVPLAEAGHMIKPSISVGGATHQSGY